MRQEIKEITKVIKAIKMIVKKDYHRIQEKEILKLKC